MASLYFTVCISREKGTTNMIRSALGFNGTDHYLSVSSTGKSKPVYISNFRPEGGMGPDTYAHLSWIPGQGFELVMWSYNTAPLARFKNPNDPVCKDS